eukprot:jgi/Bigna1/79157/fgenesh1_pg.60_\
MIKGVGDFQEIPANSLDLYLDAGSASYDPEEAKNATRVFEWSCTNHTAQQPCSAVQISANGDVFSIPSLALRYSTRFPSILNITVNFSVVSNDGTLRRSSDRSLLVRVISEDSPALFISGKSLIVSRNGLIALTANRISNGNAGSESSGSGAYRWVTIQVVDAPNVTSIRVQPSSGTAYTTTFEATASVFISDTATAPVLMSFAYFPQSTSQSDSRVLCPFSSPTV